MKISIIIVSYNVKYFLDQCIASIYQSEGDFDLEVIVVDNASSDDSIEFVQKKYKDAIVILNKENVGFSKANNIGVKRATGDFILILNPDTLLDTHTLDRCLKAYQRETKAGRSVGMIGVRMFDGSGTFLPESKRGFPSPFVSFCKIFGLSSLFPKSKLFNRYYLGHLDDEKNHFVEILTGAFMFMKKSVFEKVKGFDEDYFMYGEDIDLSYRVEQAGFENYYLSDTKIIHYKGESTRKMSFDYVRRFYEAMIIFAKKHLSGSQVLAYTLAIQSAIYLKAFFTFIKRTIKTLTHPLKDALVLGVSFYTISEAWERLYFNMDDYFPLLFTTRNIPIYVLIALMSFLVLGKYHKRFQAWNHAKMLALSLVALLVFYSLLPGTFRFSRAVIVFGGLLAALIIFGLDYLRSRGNRHEKNALVKTAVVGYAADADQLLALLDKRGNTEFLGFIADDESANSSTQYLGGMKNIESIVRFHNIDELIFNQDNIQTSEVMRIMTSLDHSCQYKIYTSNSESVVGSYSKNYRGQIDTFDIEYSISSSYGKFVKRLGDIFLVLLCVLLFPILWPLNGFKFSYWANIVNVLFNKNTFVGYYGNDQMRKDLPSIKPNILPHGMLDDSRLSANQLMNINFIYAREYNLWIDLQAFYYNFKNIHVPCN